MPFIHYRSYAGKDLETKKKTAEAIAKVAAEIWGAPESAFTIVFEDVDREVWEAEVKEAIIEPLRDKIVMEQGEIL
ncbi:MAG: tautomerase family protein [Coriobacteriia bacterium]|nr:tautomerase family protein [Coriobacteriia bacterium]